SALVADGADHVAQLIRMEVGQFSGAVRDRLVARDTRLRKGPHVVAADVARTQPVAQLRRHLPAVQTPGRSRLTNNSHAVDAPLRIHRHRALQDPESSGAELDDRDGVVFDFYVSL